MRTRAAAALGALLIAGTWAEPAAAGNPFVFRATSDSMLPNVKPGTLVVVGAWPGCGRTRAAAGDLVLYRSAKLGGGGLLNLARVVAVGGRTIAFRGGRAVVDGRALARRAAPGGAVERIGARDVRVLTSGGFPVPDFGPVRVPPNHVFVAGDNRNNAFDSRYTGAVPLSDVCARLLQR